MSPYTQLGSTRRGTSEFETTCRASLNWRLSSAVDDHDALTPNNVSHRDANVNYAVESQIIVRIRIRAMKEYLQQERVKIFNVDRLLLVPLVLYDHLPDNAPSGVPDRLEAEESSSK